MAFKIIWTQEAITTFELNIEFLKNRWTEREIKRFVLKTQETILLIQKNPLLFPISKKSKQIRKTLIVKQISLFYRFSSEINTIYLLTFWNNFQNPKKLKY